MIKQSFSIMDGRKNNGGARKGAGRKPKDYEHKVVEKLSPLEKDAYKALKQGLEENQSWAVKLWFDYTYGRPKETKDVNLRSEQPLFPDVPTNDSSQ